MRRSQVQGARPFQVAEVEDDNERLTDELKDKIGVLRTLAIDMGTEVKHQNSFVDRMSGDMENSEGFIGKTMARVNRLRRGGHNYHLLYLLIFCLFVFVVLWMYLKFQ